MQTFFYFCFPVRRKNSWIPVHSLGGCVLLQNSLVQGKLPILVCLSYIPISTHKQVQTWSGSYRFEGHLIVGPAEVLPRDYQELLLLPLCCAQSLFETP